MPGSGRRQASQRDHDRKVREIAQDYRRRGYNVRADVAGYQRPPTIGGYRPDVVASKSGQETIVEVETPDSTNSARDAAQRRAFLRAARRSEKRHYRRVITE